MAVSVANQGHGPGVPTGVIEGEKRESGEVNVNLRRSS
jgi:hypothetical protein